MRFLFLILSIGLFSACSSLPKSFTTENIMLIHQGMSSSEILKMFGEPKNVSQAVCGAATDKAWSCTTWDYGYSYSDSASFTFSGENPGALILNNFKIDRK